MNDRNFRTKHPGQVVRKTRDGSIVHADGRTLFFSVRRFIKDICAGNRCFVCGADPAKVPFNDEHVLPDWVLRKYKLHQRQITLPNLSQYRYGNYQVPCCQQCNGDMGRLIEKPISNIVAGGVEAVRRHLAQEGPLLLYTWLSLIFLKTHLRDRQFRVHLDQRKGNTKIAEWYEWEELHHIHCVARSFHSRASVAQPVIGSFAVVEARNDPREENFDYADLYAARTILIRLDKVCFIAVLNDSGAALQYVNNNDLSRITGTPTGIQLRELMARFALINMKLKERPIFKTAVHELGMVRLVAELPQRPPRIHKIARKEFGLVLYGAILPAVSTIRDPQGKLLGARVKQGRVSFLYDNQGRYIKETIVPFTRPKNARRRRRSTAAAVLRTRAKHKDEVGNGR